VLITVQLHIRRPGDVLGQAAAVLDPHPRITALMHHQRGGTDDRQHLAHVDGHIHPVQRLKGCGAGAIAVHPGPRPYLVLARRWDTGAHQLLNAPGCHERAEILLDPLAVFPLGGAEKKVRRPQYACQASIEHQRRYPAGMGRGEDHAHRHAVRKPEEGCAVGPGRVHHRPDVIAALLQRRRPRDPVGQARAPLVKKITRACSARPRSKAVIPLGPSTAPRGRRRRG
jgi:hypothetical protein